MTARPAIPDPALLALGEEPSRQSFRARWVFPVDSPPIANGTVEIEAGRITAVHDRDDPRAQDLGDVALLPGLVNAHTHLEFSDLEVPVGPAQPFTAWIRSLVTARRERAADPVASIRQGLEEVRAAGTSLVGEIATSPALFSAVDPTAGRLPRIIAFRELIGLPHSRKEAQLAIAREHLSGSAPDAANTTNIVRGLSPHAPYSVHPDLYRALVDLAREHRAPLAIHLAETRAELELLAHGTGEFVTMLDAFGAWEPTAIPPGSRPFDYLRPLADLETALVIHGNYLAGDELDFLEQHANISVVYCPRTHAYFGHSPHPWKEMLQRGISLAVGTDSRGSNPDLCVWRELCFLRAEHPEVDPAVLLRLGTLDGARALGQSHETGSLTPGKRADIAVVRLPATSGSPYDALFAGHVLS